MGYNKPLKMKEGHRPVGFLAAFRSQPALPSQAIEALHQLAKIPSMKALGNVSLEYLGVEPKIVGFPPKWMVKIMEIPY